MYLLVVGTQHTFTGVCHTVSTADGTVDHCAGHHLSAILQRGSWVLAAVKLGNIDSKSSGTGSALCKGVQTHTHTFMPFRICHWTNYGYILTHSSWKTSNFLSQSDVGEDWIKAWRQTLLIQFCIYHDAPNLAEPTRILENTAQK